MRTHVVGVRARLKMQAAIRNTEQKTSRKQFICMMRHVHCKLPLFVYMNSSCVKCIHHAKSLQTWDPQQRIQIVYTYVCNCVNILAMCTDMWNWKQHACKHHIMCVAVNIKWWHWCVQVMPDHVESTSCIWTETGYSHSQCLGKHVHLLAQKQNIHKSLIGHSQSHIGSFMSCSWLNMNLNANCFANCNIEFFKC